MIIEPKILKGFRDFLPDQEIERRRIAEIIERVCQRGGFVPIDTPVLEYEEVLLGKGGGETDKQVYRFKDHGSRDVAMRFDLTVPFARFVAAHFHELPMPFKRYHLSKVWRGENTQRGRYREFMQSDFDIVGTDSVHADMEILLLIYECFAEMGIKNIRIHISHRGIFNSLLKTLQLESKQVEILRSVDKLQKIGTGKVCSLLADLMPEHAVTSIMDFVQPEASFVKTIEKLKKFFPSGDMNIDRMETLFGMIKDCGIAGAFTFDTSITRGLDYYTGIVYETFLNDLPAIGSVCSGGRYDNLASLYTKEIIPGVGASIGLDRLMAGLEDLGLLEKKMSMLDVLIVMMDDKYGGYYHALSHKLRNRGIAAEVYLESKKMGIQFKYAEKKGIPFALICGEDEILSNKVTLKNLKTRENKAGISLDEAIRILLDQKA